MNSVANLIECPFTSRTLDEQLGVLLKGRPQPRLKELDPTNAVKGFYRRFTWLCGCDTEKALFCFPCVLYGNKFEEIWSKSGFKDITNLTREAEKHLNGHYHLLSNKKIDRLLTDEASKLKELKEAAAFIEHKKEIERTKYVLPAVIDSICYGITSLSNFGDYSDYGVLFLDMFELLESRDPSLHKNFEKIKLFSHVDNCTAVQSDLLQAMLEVCHERMTEEIQESNFLAVIVEDASEVCAIPCFSVILRYLFGGKAVERFWSYVGHENTDLAHYILDIMEKFEVNKTPYKLIAQVYDGSPQLAGTVQKVVKDVYPRAHYIHSHTFNLDTVMKRAVSDNREILIFFANLQSICNFFSISPRTIARMRMRHPSIQFPDEDTTLSKSIRIISENRSDIIKCLDSELNEESTVRYNVASLSSMPSLISILESDSFLFWLSFFRSVMSSLENLSEVLDRGDLNLVELKESLKRFENTIEKISDVFTEDCIHSLPLNTTTDRNKQAIEACEQLVAESKVRFACAIHLIAEQLFDPDKYSEYIIRFPEDILNNFCIFYNFIDVRSLRRELETIYKSSEYRQLKRASDLYENIVKNGHQLPETMRVLEILLTTRSNSPDLERSVLERVRKFPLKKKNEEFGDQKPVAMAMIERDFMKEIPDFQDKVMAKFLARPEWNEYFDLNG